MAVADAPRDRMARRYLARQQNLSRTALKNIRGIYAGRIRRSGVGKRPQGVDPYGRLLYRTKHPNPTTQQYQYGRRPGSRA